MRGCGVLWREVACGVVTARRRVTCMFRIGPAQGRTLCGEVWSSPSMARSTRHLLDRVERHEGELCARRTALPLEFRGPAKRLFDNVVAPRRHTVGARAQGPGRRGRRSPPSTSSRRASTQRCAKRAVFAHPHPPPEGLFAPTPAARGASSHPPYLVFAPTPTPNGRLHASHSAPLWV